MTSDYVGNELDLFAAATNWKSYLATRMSRYLGPRVLEVGAGFGGTTKFLCRKPHERWVCLEPDERLAARAAAAILAGELPACCEAVVGTVDTVGGGAAFDTIVYTDVLEHIEDDRAEMARAAAVLAAGGHLVVLSPAHQWLYTPFDKAIGHFRRYTKKTLRAVTPDGTDLVRLNYLDAVGLLASLANKLLLGQSMPNAKQIALWDRVMVRASRIADPVLFYSLGKSVLGVWRKGEA